MTKLKIIMSSTGSRMITTVNCHSSFLHSCCLHHGRTPRRGNSAARQPRCISRHLNHRHSTNHATYSKLTLPRRLPAIPLFTPPSRPTQQIQGVQRSGAGVCPTVREHMLTFPFRNHRHIELCHSPKCSHQLGLRQLRDRPHLIHSQFYAAHL